MSEGGEKANNWKRWWKTWCLWVGVREVRGSMIVGNGGRVMTMGEVEEEGEGQWLWKKDKEQWLWVREGKKVDDYRKWRRSDKVGKGRGESQWLQEMQEERQMWLKERERSDKLTTTKCERKTIKEFFTSPLFSCRDFTCHKLIQPQPHSKIFNVVNCGKKKKKG